MTKVLFYTSGWNVELCDYLCVIMNQHSGNSLAGNKLACIIKLFVQNVKLKTILSGFTGHFRQEITSGDNLISAFIQK